MIFNLPEIAMTRIGCLVGVCLLGVGDGPDGGDDQYNGIWEL